MLSSALRVSEGSRLPLKLRTCLDVLRPTRRALALSPAPPTTLRIGLACVKRVSLVRLGFGSCVMGGISFVALGAPPTSSDEWTLEHRIAPMTSSGHTKNGQVAEVTEIPPWDKKLDLPRFLRLLWRCSYLSVLFTPLIWVSTIQFLLPSAMCPSAFETLRDRLLLLTLEWAGPTFIKFGQWMSTRPDLFARHICSVLFKLTVTAPSHSWKYTEEVLQRVFPHQSIDDVFLTINKKSLHSGAIAQVYKAVLRQGEGQEVAVKVLHPNIIREVYDDLWLMNAVANTLDRIPTMKWLAFPYFAQEFSRGMARQLDLCLEGAHLQKFAANFQQRDKPWVAFPRVVDLSTISDRKKQSSEVLLMSWEDGQSIRT